MQESDHKKSLLTFNKRLIDRSMNHELNLKTYSSEVQTTLTDDEIIKIMESTAHNTMYMQWR